jgi:hypothetical protein
VDSQDDGHSKGILGMMLEPKLKGSSSTQSMSEK